MRLVLFYLVAVAFIAPPAQALRTLIKTGTSTFPTGAPPNPSGGNINGPSAAGSSDSGSELDPSFSPSEPGTIDAPQAVGAYRRGRLRTNRVQPTTSLPRKFATTVSRTSASKVSAVERLEAKDTPFSFKGLSVFDSRYAFKGNQFQNTPPDQGLCVGNGFIVEMINAAVRVFNASSGAPLTVPIALNEFYGYHPTINRTDHTHGPSLGDPSCLFDTDSQRWFLITYGMKVNVTTGNAIPDRNSIEIAVSASPDPLGAWNLYYLPTQNDGSEGTPVHANCPCFGDYPQLGANADGFYITTNEFSSDGSYFNGAVLYAFPKAALVSGQASPSYVDFFTGDPQYQWYDSVNNLTVPMVSMIPARSAFPSDFHTANGGVQYFVVSVVGIYNPPYYDNRLIVCALQNTQLLNNMQVGSSGLVLDYTVLTVRPMASATPTSQKSGSTPLRDCLNDRNLNTSSGMGCYNILGIDAAKLMPRESELLLDALDSRAEQVTFSNGVLYTSITVLGDTDSTDSSGGPKRKNPTSAPIATNAINYYAIKLSVDNTTGALSAAVLVDGTLAVAGNSVIRGAFIGLASGSGVLSFNIVGPDYFPSAAYAIVDTSAAASSPGSVSGKVKAKAKPASKGKRDSPKIVITGSGAGPSDDFTGYYAFGADGVARWGDYAQSVLVDESTVFAASEYIPASCNLNDWLKDVTCGGTRTSHANFATRITKITVA